MRTATPLRTRKTCPLPKVGCVFFFISTLCSSHGVNQLARVYRECTATGSSSSSSLVPGKRGKAGKAGKTGMHAWDVLVLRRFLVFLPVLWMECLILMLWLLKYKNSFCGQCCCGQRKSWESREAGQAGSVVHLDRSRENRQSGLEEEGVKEHFSGGDLR